jgi:hypothetical protein
LIGVEGKVGEAEGFQILIGSHFASPAVRQEVEYGDRVR